MKLSSTESKNNLDPTDALAVHCRLSQLISGFKIAHQHKVLTTQLVHEISNLQLCV